MEPDDYPKGVMLHEDGLTVPLVLLCAALVIVGIAWYLLYTF